jgi:large subunit ribosomal protein L31
MKKDIHPKWNPEAKVVCSCGNEFSVGSTKEEIRVEICAKCHPLYTGEMKFIDTAGRVEKFKQRVDAVKPENLLNKKARKLARKQEEEEKEAKRPKSLKEMLSKKHESE